MKINYHKTSKELPWNWHTNICINGLVSITGIWYFTLKASPFCKYAWSTIQAYNSCSSISVKFIIRWHHSSHFNSTWIVPLPSSVAYTTATRLVSMTEQSTITTTNITNIDETIVSYGPIEGQCNTSCGKQKYEVHEKQIRIDILFQYTTFAMNLTKNH